MAKKTIEYAADVLEGVEDVMEDGLSLGVGIIGGTVLLTTAFVATMDYDYDPTPDGAETVMTEMEAELELLAPHYAEQKLSAAAVDRAELDLEIAQLESQTGGDVDLDVYETALMDAVREQAADEAEFDVYVSDFVQDMFNNSSALGERNVETLKDTLVDRGYGGGDYSLDFTAAALSGCDLPTVASDEAANSAYYCTVENTEAQQGSILMFLPSIVLSMLGYMGLATGAGAAGRSLRRQGEKKRALEN